MKGLEKRKARIDADVMERFVPSCSRCVNSVGNGYGDYWCRNYIFGSYYMYISSGVMKEDCKHYKRKI